MEISLIVLKINLIRNKSSNVEKNVHRLVTQATENKMMKSNPSLLQTSQRKSVLQVTKYLSRTSTKYRIYDHFLDINL